MVCGVYMYIEDGDYGLGCVLKGVESKVLVVVKFIACRCV